MIERDPQLTPEVYREKVHNKLSSIFQLQEHSFSDSMLFFKSLVRQLTEVCPDHLHDQLLRRDSRQLYKRYNDDTILILSTCRRVYPRHGDVFVLHLINTHPETIHWQNWESLKFIGHADISLVELTEKIIAHTFWVQPIVELPPSVFCKSQPFNVVFDNNLRFLSNTICLSMPDFVSCFRNPTLLNQKYTCWQYLCELQKFLVVTVHDYSAYDHSASIVFNLYLPGDHRKIITQAILKNTTRPAYIIDALVKNVDFMGAKRTKSLFSRVTESRKRYVSENVVKIDDIIKWIASSPEEMDAKVLHPVHRINPYTLRKVQQCPEHQCTGGVIVTDGLLTRACHIVFQFYYSGGITEEAIVVVYDPKRKFIWDIISQQYNIHLTYLEGNFTRRHIHKKGIYMTSRRAAVRRFPELRRMPEKSIRLFFDTAESIQPRNRLTELMSSLENPGAFAQIWLLLTRVHNFEVQARILQTVISRYSFRGAPIVLDQHILLENFTVWEHHTLAQVTLSRKKLQFQCETGMYVPKYFQRNMDRVFFHCVTNPYEKSLHRRLKAIDFSTHLCDKQKQILEILFSDGDVPRDYLFQVLKIMRDEGPDGLKYVNDRSGVPPPDEALFFDNNNYCPLCLTTKQEHTMRRVQCGHIFCRECLVNMMKSQDTDQCTMCPICRKSLPYTPRKSLVCWPLNEVDPESAYVKLHNKTVFKNMPGPTSSNTAVIKHITELKTHAIYKHKKILVLFNSLKVKNEPHDQILPILHSKKLIDQFLTNPLELFASINVLIPQIHRYVKTLALMTVDEVWVSGMGLTHDSNRTLLEISEGKCLRFFGEHDGFTYTKMLNMRQKKRKFDYFFHFNKYTNRKLVIMYIADSILNPFEVTLEDVYTLTNTWLRKQDNWERKYSGYIFNSKLYFDLSEMKVQDLIQGTSRCMLSIINNM